MGKRGKGLADSIRCIATRLRSRIHSWIFPWTVDIFLGGFQTLHSEETYRTDRHSCDTRRTEIFR